MLDRNECRVADSFGKPTVRIVPDRGVKVYAALNVIAFQHRYSSLHPLEHLAEHLRFSA
jgi:hypothetical protein